MTTLVFYLALRHSRLSDVDLASTLVIANSLIGVSLEAVGIRTFTISARRPFTAAICYRAARRWLGCLLGLGLVTSSWFVFPEYAQTAYKPFFLVFERLFAIAPVLTLIVIVIAEWKLGSVADDVSQFSTLIFGPRVRINWITLREGVLSWIIKGFFLPINFCDLTAHLGHLRQAEYLVHNVTWPILVYWLSTAIYAALLASIVPGYLFGSRLFGNEVRNIDQSWFGWTITLICYGPLSLGVSYWLNFHVPFAGRPAWETPWVAQTGGFGLAAGLIGGAIVALDICHLWGESIFGIRSSNLSNRGIITNGPYRFCKHPVYVIKCLQWFLIWLPPIAGKSLFKDFQLTIMWLGVCGIYLMRAWVEEKLLYTDPIYLEYGLRIDERSLFRYVGRIAPFTSFRWRITHWAKRGCA